MSLKSYQKPITSKNKANWTKTSIKIMKEVQVLHSIDIKFLRKINKIILIC